MGKFIYKYSKNVYLSYILFSCLFYSFYAITGLRQTIATALVVFCGIDLIKERKFYKFVFLIMIASTIHASALCFLPFYWISRINISYKMILVYWGLIIGSFLFKNQVFNVFRLISGYDNYEFYSGATGGTFLLLLLLLALFSSIFYKKIIGNHRQFGGLSVEIEKLEIIEPKQADRQAYADAYARWKHCLDMNMK